METNDQAQLLAELTRLIQPKPTAAHTDKILAQILVRLENLETQIADFQLTAKKNKQHPSQEKFQIAELNELMLAGTNEKACRFEPDKPCDYCSLCSAQGF